MSATLVTYIGPTVFFGLSFASASRLVVAPVLRLQGDGKYKVCVTAETKD